MVEHRYVGTYPTTDANGAPLEPGGTVDFDPDSHSNDAKYYKVMLDSGTLVSTADEEQPDESASTKSSAKRTAKDKEG